MQEACHAPTQIGSMDVPSAIALILTLMASAVGCAQPAAPPSGVAQPSAPPASVGSFLDSLVGEWIGTCVQSTDGKAAGNKYFHAVIKQPGPDTYETVFEYYRLDEQTGAPLKRRLLADTRVTAYRLAA